MSKIKITSIIATPDCVICVGGKGGTYNVTNQAEMDWLLDEGVRIFTQKSRQYYLEYDPENGHELYTLRDRDGNELRVFRNSLSVDHTDYRIDTSVLKKFVDYAVNHEYDITPFLKKVTHCDHTQALLEFLNYNNLPVTCEGNILAFKVLQKTDSLFYTDCHTKLVRQNVGDVVQMEKRFVDPDPYLCCSVGLHVCSLKYLSSFFNANSQVVALVLVDPKDIVTVPSDCMGKARCCKYQILGILPNEEITALLDKSLENAPVSQKLINDCVLEQFTGINRIITIKVDTVKSLDDYTTRIVDSFEINGKKEKLRIDKMITSLPEPTSRTNLMQVLFWLKQVKANNRLLKNRDMLLKLKELHQYFTWKELKIDDNLRRKIAHRMERYGING